MASPKGKNQKFSNQTAPAEEEVVPAVDVKETKSNKPAALITLLKCSQITERDTKVILRQNQPIPVPFISEWARTQEKHGLLTIQEL